MRDEDIHPGLTHDPRVSRRAFGFMSVAVAGLATNACASTVVETDVAVKTPDGEADAALFHPAGQGAWPAVIVWPDILGLRPVFREMGRRLAAQGYVVIVPNPFYRTRRAPVVEGAFDWSNAADRAKVMALRDTLTDDGVDRDARALIAYLDARPQTDRGRKAGVQGYCMGGAMAFRTAAAAPERVGAVASFHGGGLVTEAGDSPHRLIPATRASFLVAIARNDDAAQPDAKDRLKAAFAEARRPAVVEVYPAEHGWCVKGSPVYDEPAAERAWAELSRLYETALA